MDARNAIEKILGGESEVFAALVKRYEGPLFACALARVYDREDAQDLCQETFLRAYLSLRTLKNPDAFGPWLFMILRRLCVDFLRGKWRRSKGEAEMSHLQAEAGYDLHSELCADDVANTLWRLVGQLDENSREVLALHYGQQMKIGEISALTGLGESTVKMRLQKARTLLGQRAEELQGAWGQVVAPSFSAGTMEWIKTAAPMASAPLTMGPLAAMLAYFGGVLLMQQKDLDRWRQHVPDSMAREYKHKTRWAVARALAVMCFIYFFPALKAHIPYLEVCTAVTVLTFCGIGIKRELELMRPSEKARFFVFLALEFLLVAIMVIVPGKGVPFVCFSGIVLLMGFFTSAIQTGVASILPGVWLMPVLKYKQEGQTLSRTLSFREIKRWLTILYELGLVAAPVKKDRNGITVQLRLRSRFWSKIGWGISYSTLRADTSGAVTCEITPQDYVALARHFGPVQFPSRRELFEALGNRFAAAYAVCAAGGEREETAECLGLSECPIDGRHSHIFRFARYALIILGGIGIIVGLCLG